MLLKKYPNLLHKNATGVLARVFAREAKLVPGVTQQAIELAQRVVATSVDGFPFARQFEFLIPCDKRYPDVDCGETASALRKEICSRNWGKTHVSVSEVGVGDLYCRLLNKGMSSLRSKGCTYGLVTSIQNARYWNQPTAEAMIRAAKQGALAVGLAIPELEESVMQGLLSNTCALWRIPELQEVGGFDLMSAQIKIGALRRSFAEAWDSERGHWIYDWHGTEEIVPLARLIEDHGECIACVLPTGNGTPRYVAPDPVTDLIGWKRHMSKMQTKRDRQLNFAIRMGKDLTYFQGGVMPAYRHPLYIK